MEKDKGPNQKIGKNSRKIPDSEEILSNQLEHEIRNSAGLVQTFDNGKPENVAIFQSLSEKYPLLKKTWKNPVFRKPNL